MPRLILDVMGGDYAPISLLEGARQALPELTGELWLVGDENVVLPFFSKSRFRDLKEALELGENREGCKLKFIHSPDTIEMADSIKSIRKKPKASINIGCQLAAQDWKASQDADIKQTSGLKYPSAFISAGHSGAVMASALIHMGRLPGIERPAIAIKLPTLKPDGCILLDIGANVDCKPEHLRDFAVMGAHFASVERVNKALPKVALLANGEERSKGNLLTRETLEQIEKLPCFAPGPSAIAEFVGYAEGKEIFKGSIDVFVTDGFTGNVVLKSLESLGEAVVTLLKNEVRHNPVTTLGLLFAAPVLSKLKRKLDYAEYGAAPLLGVAGYAFICHGRSKAKAIKNALLRSQSAVKSHFVEHCLRGIQ